MNPDVAYRQCEAITRREAKNFSYGIRLLKEPERHALSAVYALARRIDDIGDGDAPAPQRLEELAAVRKDLEPISADTDDPVLAGVAHAADRYGLPMAAFGELIDGCEMDVEGDVVRHHRRPGRVLPPGGRLGRAPLAGRLRRGRPGRGQSAGRRPRRGSPADQHPPRHRRGRGPGPGLPAGRGRRSRGVPTRPERAARRRSPTWSPSSATGPGSGSTGAFGCCRCSTAGAGPAWRPWPGSTAGC